MSPASVLLCALCLIFRAQPLFQWQEWELNVSLWQISGDRTLAWGKNLGVIKPCLSLHIFDVVQARGCTKDKDKRWVGGDWSVCGLRGSVYPSSVSPFPFLILLLSDPFSWSAKKQIRSKSWHKTYSIVSINSYQISSCINKLISILLSH